MHTTEATMTTLKTPSVLLALLAIPAVATAAPGDLDTSFGDNGFATIGSGQFSSAATIAIQPDGTILGTTAGNNALVVFRLLANGSPDASFGNNGTAAVTTIAAGRDLVVDDSGRIYVAYSTGDTDYRVARLLPDGTLDSSFGGDGIVQASVGALLGTGTTANNIHGMTLLPGGKLLLVGNYWSGQLANQDVGIVRLNPDGTPDQSFGTGGATPVRLLNLRPVWGIEATLQSDGKIVVVADENTTGSENLWVLRYLADGSELDESFGQLGLAQIDIEGTVGDNIGRTTGTTLVVQPDDRVVVAGRVGSSRIDTFVARFTADGTLDTTFSGDGYIILQFADSRNRGGTELALQADGKILVGDSGGLTRLTATGEVDTSFAGDGTASSGSPIASRDADTIAIQLNGDIVVGGSTFDPATSDTDPVIMRFEGENVDLTPDAFAFTDVSNAAADTVITSDAVSVSGLTAGVFVPVRVAGGELALDGSGNFGPGPAFATTGTQVNVRHTSSSNVGESTDTMLSVGGLFTHNNLLLALGSSTSDTFTSTVGGGVPDTDNDGVPDDTDNAPNDPNPDQGDIDNDGVGDVADPCPADLLNNCNTDRSTAQSIDDTGGTLTTPDGTVSVIVPAGALPGDTSISITDLGTGFIVNTDAGETTAIIGVNIGPDGQAFAAPVDIVFTWPDSDNDGVVDGTADAESDLRIFKDGVAITDICANAAGCNAGANTFTVQVTSLSDFILGTIASGGGGGGNPPPPPPPRKRSGGGAFGVPGLLLLFAASLAGPGNRRNAHRK